MVEQDCFLRLTSVLGPCLPYPCFYILWINHIIYSLYFYFKFGKLTSNEFFSAQQFSSFFSKMNLVVDVMGPHFNPALTISSLSSSGFRSFNRAKMVSIVISPRPKRTKINLMALSTSSLKQIQQSCRIQDSCTEICCFFIH